MGFLSEHLELTERKDLDFPKVLHGSGVLYHSHARAKTYGNQEGCKANWHYCCG